MKNHSSNWLIINGDTPVVATAIHDGHKARAEVSEHFAISEADRLREEDPGTGMLTTCTAARVIALHSRFEADLNRPRELAVYRRPEDSWGLQVWQGSLPAEVIEGSLGLYDAFYQEMRVFFTSLQKRYQQFVVFDLHSYNHRRAGATAPPAAVELNPEVNIGTSNLNLSKWEPLLLNFQKDLKAYNFQGRSLDVRIDVKFRGGHFSRWIHDNFPESACVLPLEFKKFFMDEWTGQTDQTQLQELRAALRSTLPAILQYLSSR